MNCVQRTICFSDLTRRTQRDESEERVSNPTVTEEEQSATLTLWSGDTGVRSPLGMVRGRSPR